VEAVIERDETPHLTFLMAGEEYAVRLRHVREIVEYDTITRVPSTPPWIRGVINLRGGVLAVVDLAIKFGLPESEVTRRTCIIVVEVELEGQLTPTGVLAEAVSQVVTLDAGRIEAAPAFGTRVAADYLLGIGRVDERLVPVLDIERVLSAGELLAAPPPEAVASVGTPEAGPVPSPAGAKAAHDVDARSPRRKRKETPRG
jgi:purine-binding chemotaxis protein CheW